jgi:uncharacterized peroxidase-related enzyme
VGGGWYTYIADSRKEPMSHFTTLKNAKSIVDVFAENPKKYMVSLSMAEKFLREEANLSEAERETIAALTSNLNNCQFCKDSHVEFAISVGADANELKDILEGNYASHRLASVYDYVTKLTLSPSSLNKEDFDKVVNSGVTEEELKEAVAVCAAFNYFNRIVEGHFIETNKDGFAEDAKMINQFGYDRSRFNG